MRHCRAPAGRRSRTKGDYATLLLEARAFKDEFLKNDPSSRVPLDRRSWMVPLRYYELDLSYRVPANLAIADDQTVVDIPTSTGQMRRMQHIGHLEFVLHGQSYRLAALLSDNDDGLFVPFRDETNRTETYPAGRYLDLPFSPTGVYDLDFNRRLSSRIATSTRSSTARSRRRRTGCRRRCGRARSCLPKTSAAYR